MKLKISLFTLSIFFLLSSYSNAQKIRVTSGKLKSLAKHKSYNFEYSYFENMVVGSKTEKEYLSEKRASKNENEAGSGDAWVEAWNNDKNGGRFFKRMETLFVKTLAEYGVSGSRNNENATCTIKVNVHFMDPGFNVGVMRKPALVSMRLVFEEDGKGIASAVIEKSPGRDAMGYDFSVARRLEESFAKAGKTLAKALAKSAYK